MKQEISPICARRAIFGASHLLFLPLRDPSGTLPEVDLFLPMLSLCRLVDSQVHLAMDMHGQKIVATTHQPTCIQVILVYGSTCCKASPLLLQDFVLYAWALLQE